MTETINDNKTATDIATAISLNNWPTSNSIIRIGINDTVVNAETKTAPKPDLHPQKRLRGVPVVEGENIFQDNNSRLQPCLWQGEPRERYNINRSAQNCHRNKDPTIDTGIASEMTRVSHSEEK